MAALPSILLEDSTVTQRQANKQGRQAPAARSNRQPSIPTLPQAPVIPDPTKASIDELFRSLPKVPRTAGRRSAALRALDNAHSAALAEIRRRLLDGEGWEGRYKKLLTDFNGAQERIQELEDQRRQEGLEHTERLRQKQDDLVSMQKQVSEWAEYATKQGQQHIADLQQIQVALMMMCEVLKLVLSGHRGVQVNRSLKDTVLLRVFLGRSTCVLIDPVAHTVTIESEPGTKKIEVDFDPATNRFTDLTRESLRGRFGRDQGIKVNYEDSDEEPNGEPVKPRDISTIAGMLGALAAAGCGVTVMELDDPSILREKGGTTPPAQYDPTAHGHLMHSKVGRYDLGSNIGGPFGQDYDGGQERYNLEGFGGSHIEKDR